MTKFIEYHYFTLRITLWEWSQFLKATHKFNLKLYIMPVTVVPRMAESQMAKKKVWTPLEDIIIIRLFDTHRGLITIIN